MNILLLGCGDPRHILFTAWTLHKAGGLSVLQNLNFVFCDVDPSILARNIIFKLILDNEEKELIWSLFYSKWVDQRCVDLLASCATSLIAIGDIYESWQKSNFGQIISIADKQTFENVHKIWIVYAHGSVSSKKSEQLKSYELHIKEKYIKDSSIYTSALQCSPVCLEAFINVKNHSNTAREYILSNRLLPSLFLKANCKDLQCNPLMLNSEDQTLNFHYGLDPLCGFHLSLAYIPCLQSFYSSTSTSNMGTTKDVSNKIDSNLLYHLCFNQFSQWCSAVHTMLSSSIRNDKSQTTTINQIKMFFFAGDAFDCCHGIVNVRSNIISADKHPIIKSCSISDMDFVSDIPTEFDLIDTSNLSDHLGLLNILCACWTLLKKELHSTIITDILSTASNNIGEYDVFLKEMLRCDLSTFTLITGLSVSEYTTKISTSYRLFENSLLSSDMRSQRTNLSFEWRFPSSNKLHVEMNTEVFVDIFFKIYKKIFEPLLHPNFSVFGDQKALSNFVVQNSGQNVYASPNVQTYARLICVATNKMQLIEKNSIVVLLELIRNSNFLGIGNYIQDFYVWFYLLKLLSDKDFTLFIKETIGFCKVKFGQSLVQNCLNNFISCPSKQNYPKLILVTLLVPRTVIESKLETDFSSTILEMKISDKKTTADNRFSSFHIAFVRERFEHHKKDNIFHNAEKDKINNSMLTFNSFTLLEGTKIDYQWIACSVLVPIPCLLIAPPNDVKVCLTLSHLMVGRKEIISLGKELIIDYASLNNIDRVSWCEYNRDNHHHFIATTTVSNSIGDQIHSSNPSVVASISNFKATLKNLSSQQNKAAGENFELGPYSGTITFKGISLEDVTPELIEMSHPLYAQLKLKSVRITFELPVLSNIAKSRIQISRKGGYVNLLMPLEKSEVVSTDRIFWMFSEQSKTNSPPNFTIFGVSRILLDSMPKINCSLVPKKSWLFRLAGSQLSSPSERVTVKKKTALVSLKETIHSLVLNFVGDNQHGTCHRLIGFNSTSHGVEIIVFVNSIRVDVSLGSVVLDTAVCILDENKNLNIVPIWFQDEMSNKKFPNISVNVTDEEMILWKKSLPVFCERIRNNWAHTKHCEYISHTTNMVQIPLSLEMGKQVVCSCCNGKGLENTEFHTYLSLNKIAFQDVYPHFFRAGIPLLFNPSDPFTVDKI